MGSGGDFRDDTAEAFVEFGLGGNDVGQHSQVAGDDCGGGFVAGGFDGEEVFGHGGMLAGCGWCWQ